MDMIDISTTSLYIYGHIQTNKINRQIPILIYGCGIVVLILGLMTIAFHWFFHDN